MEEVKEEEIKIQEEIQVDEKQVKKEKGYSISYVPTLFGNVYKADHVKLVSKREMESWSVEDLNNKETLTNLINTIRERAESATDDLFAEGYSAKDVEKLVGQALSAAVTHIQEVQKGTFKNRTFKQTPIGAEQQAVAKKNLSAKADKVFGKLVEGSQPGSEN